MVNAACFCVDKSSGGAEGFHPVAGFPLRLFCFWILFEYPESFDFLAAVTMCRLREGVREVHHAILTKSTAVVLMCDGCTLEPKWLFKERRSSGYLLRCSVFCIFGMFRNVLSSEFLATAT